MSISWKITSVRTSSSFERAFRKLPQDLRQRVIKRLTLFQTNPTHPRLDTHKMTGKLAGDWAFSVDYHNRIRFRIVEEGVILLIDVGSHDSYKKP